MMSTPPAPSTPSVAQMLECLLSQMQDYAVVLLDTDGRVLAWRGAAAETFGYTEMEMLGQPVDLLFTPEDRALGLPEHERRVAGTDGRAEDDRWHLRKDGTRIWVMGSVTPLRDGDGRLLGFGKVMRDRTDVRMQIETLERRNEDLGRTHHDKDVFFARLSHEVRNSLGPLRNAAELIRRAAEPAQLEFPLALVQRQLELLGRMAEDLSQVARIGAGKLTLTLEEFNLNERLALIAEAALPHAKAKGQTMHTLLPSGPVIIQADPERLHQIVYNLLDNAIKYTPRQGRVWLKLAVEGPQAVVRVEDSGDGIRADLLPRIFDLFTQGESKHSEGGFGVGLSLVKDLVHAHGGSVEARSTGVDQGSEFTVRLPLTQPS